MLGPNILLSTLFSNALNLCSSLSVRDQVSHPYKTTGGIIELYTLTFEFLGRRREDTRLSGLEVHMFITHFFLSATHCGGVVMNLA